MCLFSRLAMHQIGQYDLNGDEVLDKEEFLPFFVECIIGNGSLLADIELRPSLLQMCLSKDAHLKHTVRILLV